MNPTFHFKADLWVYPGANAWYFVTLPNDVAEEIKGITIVWPRNGFGSVKVEVTIAQSSWKTSLFPDKKSGSFLLPIKKVIRTELGLADGDEAAISIKLYFHEENI